MTGYDYVIELYDEELDDYDEENENLENFSWQDV